MKTSHIKLKDRLLTLAAFALAVAIAPGTNAWASDSHIDNHKLALYVTANDPKTMDLVLNNAANVSRYYTGLAEDVDIVIVGFGPGVSIFLADRSPELKRIKGFEESMPNVHFVACKSSIAAIEQSEKKRPPVIDGVKTVESGVSELLHLSEEGYAIIKP